MIITITSSASAGREYPPLNPREFPEPGPAHMSGKQSDSDKYSPVQTTFIQMPSQDNKLHPKSSSKMWRSSGVAYSRFG